MTTPWFTSVPEMILPLDMNKVITIVIERLEAYQANKISDEHLEHFDKKIAEVEAQWEYPVLSEAEEDEMEWAWQLKKLEVKVWELEQKVGEFQRKLEELQVAVDVLQFSIDAEL